MYMQKLNTLIFVTICFREGTASFGQQHNMASIYKKKQTTHTKRELPSRQTVKSQSQILIGYKITEKNMMHNEEKAAVFCFLLHTKHYARKIMELIFIGRNSKRKIMFFMTNVFILFTIFIS